MTHDNIQEILIERNIKRALLQELNFRRGNKDDFRKDKDLAGKRKDEKGFNVEESVTVERRFDSD